MTNTRSIATVRPGARVMTADGKAIGTVKDLRDDSFKIDAKWAPDYWLGVETVEDASAEMVQLLITRGGIGAAKLPDLENIDDTSLPSRQ